MRVVISDTNILIDLIETEMLNVFFELPIEIITTDLVVEYELDEIKSKIIYEAAKNSRIEILESTAEQLKEIEKIFNEIRGISLTDSQVFYFAIKKNAILLSGDGNLRKFATQNGLEVHGIIWVFDLLEKNKFTNKKFLAIKMRKLLENNPRLPKEECIRRIKKWEED